MARNTNPFMLWFDFNMEAAAMLTASAEVIAQRTTRMATASLPLSARDQREFTKMSAEKGEAAFESLMAMGMASMALPFNASSALKIAHAGLKPVSRRAQANAKRLRT
ncbi:hypothetical protein [Asticcacaulis sp. EMRT-3]|uniref:hypothetical protein n=1 Tax=Asticcacaulis sp. EMRT-3 TaxID=3040349 RepID=UPI0024AE8F6B|nr:hypothetical protein [Asticcacaulis sp. EMRT-3]MDI7774179.1 hypothetical protein [Asticcacaulis sp. EMRT-3]